VGTDEVKLKHSVEERFAFVEFRVFWHGRINRADLIQRFGVSPTQASQDFKLYAELMPENLVYDGVEKAYLCGLGGKLSCTPAVDLLWVAATRGHLATVDPKFSCLTESVTRGKSSCSESGCACCRQRRSHRD
jgi:hypothetical protein